MDCSSLMKPAPSPLRADMDGGAAVALLRADGIDTAPVVYGDGAFLGLFGPQDVLTLLVPRLALAGGTAENLRFLEDDAGILAARYQAAKARRLGDVVDARAPTLSPASPPADALRLFAGGRRAVAVVAGREIKGIVDLAAVLAALTKD